MSNIMNHYAEYHSYRANKKLMCPYCYRHTYKGLEYRHSRSLHIKRILFRMNIHKFKLAV